MYPYFYPSFISPAKTGTADAKTAKANQPAAGGTMPGVPTAGQLPSMPGMAPAPPFIPEAPPIPGTTSGAPVESVPPTPPHVGPPLTDLTGEQSTDVQTNVGYTQGFLMTQIGKRVRIEFLIGTNSTTDRIGELVGVGISYVLLRLAETDDILMADIYSIKFVTIFR